MPAEVTLQFLPIWLACLALIWLPGAALARLLHLPRPSDWLLRGSLEIGLGLSIWPLLLLWSTVIARQISWPLWSPSAARITVAAAALAGLALIARGALRQPHLVLRAFLRQWPWLLLFALLFALACFTRTQHIRDLVLPNWVDSVHHVLIVRLIVEQGMLPATYTPFLADAGFSYHWGFHAWVAWLAWLLGVTNSFDLARLMLLFGQVLNVLMLWMLYAAGRALFNSRRAGFLAAALGMFVSWLPAYYTAWGRYPHLAGLLLAVPFLICLWRLARARTAFSGWLLATVLTGSALALTHVRVALFAAIWAALLLAYLLARKEWSVLWRWPAAGAGALLLISPWLITLLAHPRFPTLVATAPAAATTWQAALDRIPWRLVWTPGMRELVTLASAGFSELLAGEHPVANLRLASGAWLLLVAGILFWQVRAGRVRPTFPWRPLALLAAWCAAILAILNTDVLGLPQLAFLSLNAAAITLFVPAGLAAAGLAAWASGAVTPPRRQRLSAIVLTTALAWLGAAHMRDIVNPQTILVAPADLPALHWIRENTPPDARFAVNAWRWLGNTYAGSDAGYWIPALTDRQSILPPALYTLTLSRDEVVQINDLLDAWSAAPDLSDPSLLDRLRGDGVTHIYVGQRSDRTQAEALAKLPALELLYGRDSVYIFRLRELHATALLQGAP